MGMDNYVVAIRTEVKKPFNVNLVLFLFLFLCQVVITITFQVKNKHSKRKAQNTAKYIPDVKTYFV